jgi:hypothetical protein
MNNHPLKERRPSSAPLGFFVALCAGATFGQQLLTRYPATGWFQDHPFTVTFDWLFTYGREQLNRGWSGFSGLPFFDRLAAAADYAWQQSVIAFDLQSALLYRAAATGAVSLSGMIAATLLFRSMTEPTDAAMHISGRRMWRGYPALKMIRQVLKHPIRDFGRGILLAPGVAIDRASEVQHVGIIGTSGAGKSTIMRWILTQVLARGDKALVHDTKGDIVATLPIDSFLLLAPQDKRSVAWDVANDVKTAQDAREVAARFIKDSHDPMWSLAARDILTGIIISLQRAHPRQWSWTQLADQAFLPAGDLQTIVASCYPPAARYIELDPETGSPSKTTFSILVTLWAAIVGIVMPLADAWGRTPPNHRLSLARWISDDAGKLPKIIILQRSPRHPALSEAWIGAAIDCLGRYSAGPDLSDSNDRRIFLFLDEVAQLKKISISQLLEVGRSKGIACYLGLQDVQQLISIYGEAVAKTIIGLLGIKIIGRLQAGPSANYVANELVGQRDVAWTETVRTTSSGSGNGGHSGQSRSTQTHRATVPVVTPDILERRLGVSRSKGVVALLLGLGDVFELRWPLTSWPVRRPGTQPADWTRK